MFYHRVFTIYPMADLLETVNHLLSTAIAEVSDILDTFMFRRMKHQMMSDDAKN